MKLNLSLRDAYGFKNITYLVADVEHMGRHHGGSEFLLLPALLQWWHCPTRALLQVEEFDHVKLILSLRNTMVFKILITLVAM